MRKIFLFCAALAAFALTGCNKELGPKGRVPDGSSVEVTVSINGTVTKATGTSYSNESKVNSLQVFVFNGGEREAYRSVRGAMQALVPATAGEREVWAVVNAPSLEDIMSLDGLKSALSAFSDNAIDSFVMTGSVKAELTDGGNVPVDVRRIVSRVSIAKISTDLKDYRENYSVRVEGIYMINVAGDSKYEVGGEPAAWINKLGHADISYDALLYDAVSGVTVSNGHPYEAEHAFYPYPNIHPEQGETQDFADDWNPRGSILVIEATMFQGPEDSEGIHGYYPIVLPALERNKTYTIQEVCITRLPGDKPYKPIETGETQVTITVHDWEVGLNLESVTI